MSGLAVDNSHLPKHVREQLAKAAELKASLDAPEVAPVATETPAETPAPVSPEQTPPQTAVGETGVPDTRDPVPSAPDDMPSSDAVSAPDEWESQYRRLEQAYRTMDGRIRKLNDENTQLKAQISVYERMGAPKPASTTRTDDPRPETPDDDDDLRSILTESELEYGEELPRLVAKLTKAQLAKLQAQPTDAPAKQTPTEPAGDRHMPPPDFWAQLEELAPDYRQQNGDPKFLAWLDAGNGVNRTLLDIALEQDNALAVSEIFRLGKAASRTAANPNPSVARQVAPATAPASNTPAEPTFTMEQYRQQFEATLRGSTATEDARRTRRLELEKALRSGRVEGVPALT